MAEMAQAVPQFQYPDLLGSYVRGSMVPGALQQQQQQIQEGGLNLDQLRLTLQNQQMISDVARQQLSSQGMLGVPPGAQSQHGPTGGIQNGPQGAVSGAGAPPSAGSPAQTPDYDPQRGMFTPTTQGAIAMLQGRSPIEAMTQAQTYEQTQRKLQVQGPMALADSVASSPNADQIIRNNPSLQQQWINLAPRLGFDPFKDLTPQNARMVAAFGYNQLAGSAGLPPRSMPVQLRTVPVGVGGSVQVNDVDNKITPGAPQQETENFVMPDGRSVRTLPKAEGMRQGLTPYVPMVYETNAMPDQAVQVASDYARTHGGQLPPGFSRNPMMVAKVYGRIADDATASGDTMGAITARGAALKANGQALDQVTKLESATSSYYATLDQNLGKLQGLANQVDSSGVPVLNKVYRAWQQGVAGDSDTAKYVTYLRSVESEFAKIQSGSLGNAATSDASRKEAQDVINKYMSQGQVQAVADAMRGEGGNRLNALRAQKQYLIGQIGQGAPTQSAPASAPASASGAHPPDIQAILEKYRR